MSDTARANGSTRTTGGSREGGIGHRSSAATVLFLLLFAGAVLSDRREPVTTARLATRAASNVSNTDPLGTVARATRISGGDPRDLRVTATRRDIPRFLSVLDAGLPCPRAPTTRD